MFGFKKHCKICGKELPKNIEIKRFGKPFCTERHAAQYVELKKQQFKDNSRRGGCC